MTTRFTAAVSFQGRVTSHDYFHEGLFIVLRVITAGGAWVRRWVAIEYSLLLRHVAHAMGFFTKLYGTFMPSCMMLLLHAKRCCKCVIGMLGRHAAMHPLATPDAAAPPLEPVYAPPQLSPVLHVLLAPSGQVAAACSEFECLLSAGASVRW